MPRLLPAIALVCAVFAVSCGGGDDESSTPTAAVTSASSTPTVTGAVVEKPTEAPSPNPGEVGVANEAISVETADGVELKGHLYSPDGPKRQVLIIAAPAEQSLWAESTEAFTSEGIAVVTFDLRGYGETGGTEDPGAMTADFALVSQFVMSREYPLVYLLGVGPEAASSAAEAAAEVEDLSGVISYGAPEAETPIEHTALAPGGAFNGEDIFEDPEVTQQVLTFILSGN